MTQNRAEKPRKGVQVGALCLDRNGQVLLITSRGTGRWIIPKGWTMRDRSHADAALQEAWEEAGVRGHVGPEVIGRYHYDKTLRDGTALPTEVQVFQVAVDDLADDYREAGQRRRHWFAPAEAAARVAEPELQALLRALPA